MCHCRCVFRLAGENPSGGSTNASAKVPADPDRTLPLQQTSPSDAQRSAPSCLPNHTVQASVQPSTVLAEPSSLTSSSEAGAMSGSLSSRHRAGPGQHAKHTFSRFAWLTNAPEVRFCVLVGLLGACTICLSLLFCDCCESQVCLYCACAAHDTKHISVSSFFVSCVTHCALPHGQAWVALSKSRLNQLHTWHDG